MRIEPKIVQELIKLVNDLYSEGYIGGMVNDEEKWQESWAIAMVIVSNGEKYTDNMVGDIFQRLE